jgi:hypothetical protein
VVLEIPFPRTHDVEVLLGLMPVCEVFFWRYAIPLFTVTYEPFWKGE